MNRDMAQREMMGQPVRSLQYMLRRLREGYPFLPELAVDGIFGEETLEAVMLFQRELAPPVTGAVDWRTYQEEQYDKLAAGVRESLDLSRVYRILRGEE